MPSKKEASLQHATYFSRLLFAANEQYIEGGDSLGEGLKAFDLAWENIRIAQTWAAQNSGADDSATELCRYFPISGAHLLDLRQDVLMHKTWLEQGLLAARKTNDKFSESIILGNLGLVLADLGQTDQAIDYHRKALKISRRLGDANGEALDLLNLGQALTDQGAFSRAIRHLNKAQTIFAAASDAGGESNTLNNLGNVYYLRGDYKKAFAL